MNKATINKIDTNENNMYKKDQRSKMRLFSTVILKANYVLSRSWIIHSQIIKTLQIMIDFE